MRAKTKSLLAMLLICVPATPVYALSPAIPTTVRVCADFESDTAQLTAGSNLALIKLRDFIEMQNEKVRPSIRIEMLYPQQIRRDSKKDVQTVVNLAAERQGKIIGFLFDVKPERIPDWSFRFSQYQMGYTCNASIEASYYGETALMMCKEKGYCNIRCTSEGCHESKL